MDVAMIFMFTGLLVYGPGGHVQTLVKAATDTTWSCPCDLGLVDVHKWNSGPAFDRPCQLPECLKTYNAVPEPGSSWV